MNKIWKVFDLVVTNSLSIGSNIISVIDGLLAINGKKIALQDHTHDYSDAYVAKEDAANHTHDYSNVYVPKSKASDHEHTADQIISLFLPTSTTNLEKTPDGKIVINVLRKLVVDVLPEPSHNLAMVELDYVANGIFFGTYKCISPDGIIYVWIEV